MPSGCYNGLFMLMGKVLNPQVQSTISKIFPMITWCRELLDINKGTLKSNQCELLNFFWINKETWQLLVNLYPSDYEVSEDQN